jgi:hypothetical protein
MERVYMLLTETPGGDVRIADTGKGKPVTAREGNQHLLPVIGNELMKDRIIIGYQVIQTAGPIVREYDPTMKLSEYTQKVPRGDGEA